MKKSLALAAALALPMMAYSIPAFSAAHEKAGDPPAAAPAAVSETDKTAMMKMCESAEDKDACMAEKMAEHAKGGMDHGADAAKDAAPAAPEAQ